MELEDEADRPVSQVGQARARQRRQLLAGEANRARGRDVERADAVQEGGLSRAGRADDGEHLPFVDLEIDPLQDVEGSPHVLERLADVAGEDERGGHVYSYRSPSTGLNVDAACAG